MLLVIAIIIGIPVLLCFIYSKNIEDDLKVGVPGPKGWPLIGSLFEIHPSIKNLKIHQKFHDFHEMYGETFQIRIGPNKMIVSRDPKMIEAIVNNPKFGKSSEYKLLKDWAGENILTNNGEKWQKMRKLMTPAFHFQILERFVPIFEEKTNIMIEIIKEQSSKSIDVSSLFNNLTLDVISVHQECIALVNKVVDKIIEERRGKLLKEKENNNLNENAETSTKKRPALLDILLEAQIDGDPLTNENIRNEVKVFMFAGHETTAGTLSFISYLIAKHSEVQQKLFDEIKMNSLDKNINSLKIRDLNALSYMDNEDVKTGVPGPKGFPFIGSIFDIQPYLKKKNLYQIFHDYHEIYGETYQIRMGPVKMVISRDPKVTEAIVNNPKFGKSKQYDLIKLFFGENLLTSQGEKWHKLRKMLTPAFHFQILERFVSIFEEQVKIMVEKLETDGSIAQDVCPMFHALTLDIISETSMGVTLNAQLDNQSPFMDANQRLIDILEKRVFNGFLSVEWIFRLSPLYKEQEQNISYINKFVNKVINQRREKLQTENNNESNEDDCDKKKRPALLDILLQAQNEGQPITNEYIANEVKAFMFAGHETTAGTLSFVSYLIAKHPQVQQKLIDEIKSNFLDEKTESLKIRDLNTLSYMDNVIKESLRLFPPAPMISKCCHEDIQIGDLFIKADTTVATNIYSGHHSTKYFKNADEFNPDRFDSEVSAEDRNPYVFQPFSSGLRNCIGQKFAMLEMKTVLVKLLSTFEFNLINKDFEVELIQTGTLKPANGIPLIFKERI
uniref:CSON009391 protein n=1 Tax=Culicoides sonorensis TaxID=179676 RepID=A0A336KJ13_CULSO